PAHPLTRRRMRNSQGCRVQGDACHAAVIRQRPTMERAVVDAIAADRRAGLAKVNAHLMRATRFKSAFHERVTTQVLHDANMRDRPLANARLGAAAAPAIAAVADQPGFNAL